MSAIEQFFDRSRGDLAAALSLQVLFDQPPALDAAALTKALRAASGELAEAVVEMEPACAEQGTPLGVVTWGKHTVRLVGFHVPMPAESVQWCVAPSHYGADLKERARAHQAHLLLFHTGQGLASVERYVALAVVAGVLAGHGASVVLNEAGRTSVPAALLAPGAVEGEWLETLRGLPLPVLYCGFVKYDLPDGSGVWMRTHGAHLLGLPDLAYRAQGHHQGQDTFDLFTSMLNYLLDSGEVFAAGHTLQVGEDQYLRLRAPRAEEDFLASEGELFVCERIAADEINP